MIFGAIRQAIDRGATSHRSALLAPDRALGRGSDARTDWWNASFEPWLRGFSRRYWAELLAVGAILFVTVCLLRLYTRYALPPGTDAGQWLAISRYYLGEHVPASRDVSTVPPLVPVALAALTIVLPSATQAIVVLAAACYVSLAGVAFLLGKRITGESSGGLLAVVFVSVAQGELFDYFSMGAYPQLVGVIGMSLCLLALLELADANASRQGWLMLAAGTAITLFSHTPSATVLLPVMLCCLAYIGRQSPDRVRLARNAALSLAPALVAWFVFLKLNGSVIFGYTNVAAAYDLKGPDKLIRNIWNDPNERLLYGAAIAAIAVMLLSARDAGLRSARRMVLAVWIGALVAIIAASALRHANTDYPRFSAYLVVPVGIAVAAAAHHIARQPAVVAAIAVCVLALAGQHTMHGFDKATAFYGMSRNSDDLLATSDWLNTTGADGGITGGTREVKWLEALTGRDSLLFLPRIYITRPWEVDSAIAAEVVQRASAGVETGRFLATVNDGGQDSGKVFPVGMRVDVYHKGIYTNAFSLNDRDVRIEVAALGASQVVSLGTSERPVTTTYQDGLTHHLVTRYALPAQRMSVVRDVSADETMPRTLNVDYYIGTLPGVGPKSLNAGISRPDGSPVQASVGGSAFDATMFDDSTVPIDLTAEWAFLAAPPADADPALVWRKISMHFQVNGNEQRIDGVRTYDVRDVLASYGVRYLIDRDGDGAAFPIIRDQGLIPVYRNNEYRIYSVPQR
jgi:hypothetical protein